jgi:hypothetical protein
VLLDTPFGFQNNADELVACTRGYFADSVGHKVEVATWRRADAPLVDGRHARRPRLRDLQGRRGTALGGAAEGAVAEEVARAGENRPVEPGTGRDGNDAEAPGAADPRAALAPYVERLLELRTAARDRRDCATGDLVRDRLAKAGVEVRDTPSGPEWHLA